MNVSSVPFVRRQRGAVALGGQQAQRLQQLRDKNDSHIHEEHLQSSAGADRSPQALNGDASPVFGHSVRASRTVEAVIKSRTALIGGQSKAKRLRNTIRDARGGIQTERSEEERPRTTIAAAAGPSLRPVAAVRPATQAATTTTSASRWTHQTIAAVRRRLPASGSSARKLTRDELEWIEKQLQFSQRVGLLDKQCTSWWQTFYSSAGAHHTGNGRADEAATTTLSIQKQLDDCNRRRFHDAADLQQQLNALRDQADSVMHMVHAMRDGTQFIHDLQGAMDAFETALRAFRVAQRETFDAYVLEEKLLDRDLASFLGKIETWEQQEFDSKKAKTKPIDKRSAASREKAVSRCVTGTDAIESESDPTSQRVFLLSQEGSDVATSREIDLVKRVRDLNAQILQSGGLRGGWDDREHAVFASTLLKCGLTDEVLLVYYFARSSGGSNQDVSSGDGVDYEALVARFLRKCIQSIVTKSEHAVRNHFDWYMGHLQLAHDKKEAIHQWKQRKETERQHLIRQGLFQVDSSDHAADLNAEGAGACAETTAERALSEEDKAKRHALDAKERELRARKLDAWREEKERRANETQEQEREQRLQRQAREAKKQQELLEKKQQILLYKLQKEQESSALQRRGESSGIGSQSPPASKEELQERSRKAIELAKAKRAQLLARVERRHKQQELPERPKSIAQRKSSSSALVSGSPTDSEGSPMTHSTTLLNPTKAYEARQRTKLELKRREKERTTQGAHERYFPGAEVVSDVKIKSFGHTAIAPRAVPTWRRNL